MKIRIAIFVMLALMATYSTSRLLKTNPQASDRHVASIKSGKLHQGHSHGSAGHELPIPHTQKLSSPIKIDLELVGPAPEKPGDTFQLRAHVHSSQDLERATIVWDIPSGLKMVSGSLENTLSQIKAGEKDSLDVILEQVSDTNEQLHVIVKSNSPGMNFSSMAQYNSLDQDEIDRAISSLKQRSDEYIKNQQQNQ